ncbi:flagellar hook protein FlgE [Paracidobacterium acidisoli]|uniref:Flagellar hook protein FlgE n=1 Tax=Paracidobacterium acidisoli TaxID=2303751 RepID=A0A372IR57_9BACT|nr:flagellar hook protein FlgE [Paracidobacterium acidisoli]MBT9330296.1 flagellar hook protein FlgE [Paracidobacterium acidisoli]
MSSFSIPLTGLESAQTALNTIANNLSNMNTTAFKSQEASFSNLFYQELGSTGSGNPIEVGAGTQVDSTTTDFSDEGSITPTSSAYDNAINGNGFFVVQNGSGTEYTRDGSFTADENGNLVTLSGQSVMGYPVANGAVNTSAGLTAIRLPIGQVEAPQATTTMSMTANLDASAAAGSASAVTVPITVYDSLGESHTANVNFTKTGTNTWSYNISMADTLSPASSTTAGVTTVGYNFGAGATLDPSTNLTITGPAGAGTGTIAAPAITAGESLATYAADLNSAITTAGITGTTVTVTGNTLNISGTNISTTGNVVQDAVGTNTTGTLSFDASGNLSSPSANISGIQFAGLADGAGNLNITWNLFESNGDASIEQVSAASGSSGTLQNGYTSGQYSGFTVDSSGVISATYDNGQTAAVGQLALASVINEQGLQLDAGNSYQTTAASGAATIGVAGTDGLGSIEGKALEGSNVNISNEFSNLIVEQQAYGASSKAVTTFDQIAQETINMIH